MSSRERLSAVDALRGLAAFSVAYFHFTRGMNTALGATGDYGYLGVHVFFVISGFIIPYSMMRSGYEIRSHWLSFITKRIVRLDPPYLVAILVVVGSKYALSLVPSYPGTPPHYSAVQLLLHLGYLNAFFGYPWVDDIYWSLAVEFQYYLLIALLVPLLVSRDARVRTTTLAAMCVAALPVHDTQMVLHYLALFSLGIATFQFRAELVSRAGYLALLVPIALMTGVTVGVPEMLAGVATALTIAFVHVRPPAMFVSLGAMSYSLYLMHIPTGGRVMNFMTRLPLGRATAPIGLAIALLSAIAAAAVFHRVIERPAQRWSSALAYGRPRRERSPAPDPIALHNALIRDVAKGA